MKNLSTGMLAMLILLLIGLSAFEDDESPYWEGDITAKLKENLEAGNNITLPSGTFLVSESIIVEGYCGIVKGASDGSTSIEVAQDFKALPDPSLAQTGTEASEIFGLYKVNCDITFQDLTFNIK